MDDPRWTETSRVNAVLAEHHYLGPVNCGFAWWDEFGVVVFGSPRSRRLPCSWLELVRWCITSTVPSAGSRQWGRLRHELKILRPDVTTVVSYSDPEQGHTGALYRACNWWWAPTWHRIRPPPTGNGAWTDGKPQAAKDRWVFPLKKDKGRAAVLTINDESILRRNPMLRYREPGGVSYKLRALVGEVNDADS